MNRPEQYVWIARWGRGLGSRHAYVLGEQTRAAADGAPLNAVYYDDRAKRWRTTDDLRYADTRKSLGLPALEGEERPVSEQLVDLPRNHAPTGFFDPDPEMEETSNAARALAAARAVAGYARSQGLEADDLRTAIGDLLCDLRHLCDAHGLDFAQVDEDGTRHYEHERNLAAEEART